MKGSRGQQKTPPIVNQPSAHSRDDDWVDRPRGVSNTNCPPGLETLATIDQLFIKQKIELIEVVIGFETQNKYDIKNNRGQVLYKALEDTDCYTRNICKQSRPFDMNILDNNGNTVIHVSRPFACETCCFPSCLQNIEVSAPPGQLVGRVQQEWSVCTPQIYPIFTIRNPADEVVLLIKGPCCTIGFCKEVDYKVMSADGLFQVATISKQWSGILQEFLTDADYFGITFSSNLDVRMRAVLLGTCFLIDFMFYEH